MDTRPLGTSGLTVTVMGVGLAALGRPGYVNLGHADDLAQNYDLEAMEANAHCVLDAAYARGVRYFDTARSYGEGERFLGTWLRSRGLRRGDVTIGSKWGYVYTANWSVHADKHEVKDHSLPVLRRQSEESRSLLGDWLDLYQIHSATLDSGVLDNDEVLHELAHLQQLGWKIGLSLSGPQQADTLRRAMACSVGGNRLFDVVQATWNLLEPSLGERLREARASGMGVIVKEALANGRLTSRNHDPAFADRRARLEAVARSVGCTLDALALAAALRQGDVVLSGATTVEHLQQNLRATSVPWSDELARELAPLAEPVEQYWQTRARLAWN